MKRISILIPLVLIILCQSASLGFSQRTTLKEAMDRNQVRVNIQFNRDQEKNKPLQFDIQNLTNQKLELLLPAGDILQTTDPGVQDHVVTQGKLIALEPSASTRFFTYGMCIQGSKGGPGNGDTFTLMGPTNEALVKLASLIERNHYQDDTAQNAVWALMNDASIAGIYDEKDPHKTKAIAKFVADLKGEQVPWYNVVYEKSASDERVFSGEVSRLDAVFKYTLITHADITFGIYYADGTPLQMYFEDRARPKGNHRLRFSFEAKGLPSGTYHVKLHADGVLMEDRPVQL